MGLPGGSASGGHGGARLVAAPGVRAAVVHCTGRGHGRRRQQVPSEERHARPRAQGGVSSPASLPCLSLSACCLAVAGGLPWSASWPAATSWQYAALWRCIPRPCRTHSRTQRDPPCFWPFQVCSPSLHVPAKGILWAGRSALWVRGDQFVTCPLPFLCISHPLTAKRSLWATRSALCT